MSIAVGLIVGSGFARLGFPVRARRDVETPYGEPSSALLELEIAGRPVLALARHGERHELAPHAVNYRANVWALHESGTRWCISTNAVGTIAPSFKPGQLAVPDQLIDYTFGRASSFAPAGEVVHTEFTEPFDAALRGRLAATIAGLGYASQAGTYGVTQGPRLETAAEIDRLERDGCAMVGMTAMPEAVLARELELAYAVCAIGVNAAAGRAPGASIHGQIEEFLDAGLEKLARVLQVLVPELCAPTL